MSGRIVFLLFCAVVIVECQSQFFPIFYPDYQIYTIYKENSARPQSAGNFGSYQNGFPQSQTHYGSTDRKGPTQSEGQSPDSTNQRFDLDSRKPTDSSLIRKKPVKSTLPPSEKLQDTLNDSTNQETDGLNGSNNPANNRRNGLSTTVQPNNYQYDSHNIRPVQTSFSSKRPSVTNNNNNPLSSSNRPDESFSSAQFQPGQQTFGPKRPTEIYNNNNPFSSSNRPDGSSSTAQFQPGQQSLGASPYNLQPNPQKNPNGYRQRESEEKFKDYKPITDFSWNLFKSVNHDQAPNIVISPLSPQHLLSYLASGAVGETKDEIVRAIRYNSPNQLNSLITTMLREPGNKELQLASAFFVSDRLRLRPDFNKNLVENTKIVPTDFSNTEKFNREYNKWVAEKTKGVLSNSRLNIEPSTKMIMSSAVYFKGEWVFKFNPGGINDFYVTEDTPVKVPMMKLLKKMPYGKLQNCEWISLPYTSNDSMIIILPRKGITPENLMRTLNVQEVFDSMTNENYGNVTLTIPKFKVESRMSLINPLQKMGIRNLFTPYAQLPNIFETTEPLTISNVIQQASLEINEQGSIATSLTAFGVVALSFAPPTPDVEFTVDRPFIAMIIDRKNDFPYFIAKVSNPAA
ncbi:serpin A3-4-like [Chironomus tepperi]|uniref:serpin A3-4-like n=1 Tax=Chironomus tepperi TaxID=113505 RepID=UPI00391F9453